MLIDPAHLAYGANLGTVSVVVPGTLGIAQQVDVPISVYNHFPRNLL